MELPIHLLNSSIVSNGDMSADITSSVIEIKEARSYCIQTVYSGTPTGTLKVQGSNDNTNWSDVSGLSVSLSGSSGSSLLSDAAPAYAYVRLFYDATSGSGTLNAILNAKR